jgi:hypothetical protein
VIEGGNITFQQLNIVDSGKMALTVSGGSARFESVFFYRNTGNVRVDDGSGRCTLVGCMTNRRAPDRDDCFPVLDIDIRCGDYKELWSFSK